MNVKQIRWHSAVLAAAVIAVLVAILMLATVTSNAAEVIKEPDEDGNWTYTMSESIYREQINLEAGTVTTINISGENILAYGNSNQSCITGKGDLVITGDGILYAPEQRSISCNNLTVDEGVKLIVGHGLYISGNTTVNNAEIESESGVMQCGSSSGGDPTIHVFNNSILNIKMEFNGETVLTECNATIKNGWMESHSGDLTIDGGTYIVNVIATDPMGYYPAMTIDGRFKTTDAVIKSNSYCIIQDLEMTDSELEIIPSTPGSSSSTALRGNNMVFSGSKVNIGGSSSAGISATQQLIMTNNTEADIKGSMVGVISSDVQIIHSSGKFQVTEPENAIAAVVAIKMIPSQDQTDLAGTLTLEAVNIKEPAGGTAGKVSIKFAPSPQAPEGMIAAILDGKTPAKVAVLESGHSWDAGKVTKEPTETAEGVKTYTCTVCGATKTEAIPKLAPQDSKTPTTGADGTVFGKGASVDAAEAAISALPNDSDPAGTAFGLLQLKASKVTKNSINLKWKAVPGATKYILFANKCGTGNRYKKLGEVTGTSYTATQAAGAALQKGTYYKFMMIAADSSGKVVSTSKTVHAATKGGKVGNHKKVTVKKSVTKKAKKLKKGKTLKLKAKAVPQAKKLKVRKHRGIKYESSNPAVAKVSGKGSVKGVGKGTCYIYAYAQNGTCARMKVTVK